VEHQKNLENDIKLKRVAFKAAKRDLQSFKANKKKD
jgi:hypothetical protein